MTPDASTLTTEQSHPTQHARLIAGGHFGRTLGFSKQLAGLPIDQKAVVRAPHEKLVEFGIGLLSGIEYLSDLSEGPAPLARDPEVAQAWQLQPLADASGVSRTLAACTPATVAALKTVLEDMGQPFLDRAVSDLRQGDETLVLDADLTGRPVSSTSETFPGAAFGYMDGEIRLGYQLAEICLQTRLFGRQWLSARPYAGDTQSAPCLQDLVHEAARRLGCHPRRRTELLAQRIAACEQVISTGQAHLTQVHPRLLAQLARCDGLSEQIQAAEAQIQKLVEQPVSSRQSGPYSLLGRLHRQVAGWYRQSDHARAPRSPVQHRDAASAAAQPTGPGHPTGRVAALASALRASLPGERTTSALAALQDAYGCRLCDRRKPDRVDRTRLPRRNQIRQPGGRDRLTQPSDRGNGLDARGQECRDGRLD